MRDDIIDIVSDTSISRGTKRVKVHRNCLDCEARFTLPIDYFDIGSGDPYFCSIACRDRFDNNMMNRNFKEYIGDA